MGTNVTDAHKLNQVAEALFGENYIGTLPFGTVPRMTDKQCCIMNTSDKMPGEHWFALYKEKGCLYAYDSYGQAHLTNAKWSDDDIEQSYIETNCGQRCIAWLILANKDLKAAMLI